MAGGVPNVTWLVVEARYQQQFDDMLLVRDFFARPLSGIRIDHDLPSGAVNDRAAAVGTYNGCAFWRPRRGHLSAPRQCLTRRSENAYMNV